MQYIAYTIKKYLWLLICICGEVKKKDLLKYSPVDTRKTYQAIHELSKEKLIFEEITNEGKVLRVRSKESRRYLNMLGPLKDHHMIITDNQKYANKGVRLKRKLIRTKIMLLMITNGIYVDGIKIIYNPKRGRRTINKLDNSASDIIESDNLQKSAIEDISIYMPKKIDYMIESFSEILKKSPIECACFFTSPFVKRHFNKDAMQNHTIAINQSSIAGVILDSNIIYPVYMFSEDLTLNKSPERNLQKYLDLTHKNIYGIGPARERRSYAHHGTCLVFTGSDGKYNISKGARKLTEVYTKVFLVGFDDNKRLKNLLSSRYDLLIKEIVFNAEEIKRAKELSSTFCDAIIDNHLAIESISFDIAKIERFILAIMRFEQEGEIFCSKNSEDIIRKIVSSFDAESRIKISPMAFF